MDTKIAMLRLRNVTKSYDGTTPVLRGIDLDVAAGEIVCLLGPSGCGKSTLLRVIAGLEQAEQGEILLDGEALARLPVHRRNFGFMFQDFALFPHQSVEENIGFGLQMAGATTTQIRQRVAEMLRLVNLDGYAQRSIFALSGGERQRVALARSLAPNPRLLMLDEPLGSLDRALREELMNELRQILKQVGVTALYVTHDQEEAYAVADRLVVMNHGRIEQIGPPAALYQQPANEFVARFLGFHNLLPTQPTTTAATIRTPIGSFALSDSMANPNTRAHTLLIRPQAARTISQNGTPGLNQIRGQLTMITFRGDHYRFALTAQGDDQSYALDFSLPNRGGEAPISPAWLDQPVTVQLDPAHLTLLG